MRLEVLMRMLPVLLGLLAGPVLGCAQDVPRERPPKDKKGDAIMLSDNVALGRDGTRFVAAAPGVTANVIQADEETAAAFESLEDGLLVFRGVTAWRTNPGPGVVLLRSSLQEATAQLGADRYAINGLAAGPAYADTDSLTVEATGAGGAALSATVEAPPPLADPGALLGDPWGYGTTVRVPDGTFDLLYVFVLGDDGAPGDDGLMRFVPAMDMALEGDLRTAPLLDDVALDALGERDITPTTIYVAYYNEEMSGDFFPGREVPVQAGRMFQVVPSDLF